MNSGSDPRIPTLDDTDRKGLLAFFASFGLYLLGGLVFLGAAIIYYA